MRIDILTLFPEMFDSVLGSSILKRAAEDVSPVGPGADKTQVRPAVVSYHLHDIRGYSEDRHSKVDRPPYGGGPGMVMQCQPVWDAVVAAEAQDETKATRIVMCPQGQTLTQSLAQELSTHDRLLLLAGHYEGFDQRVLDKLDEPETGGPLMHLSIGDYVLSGGEVPAMVLIDTVVRLIPGVLGDDASTHDESFSPGTEGLLDYPHYTRPREWMGLEVPDVLLSGDHGKIAQWRTEQSQARTRENRPDLLLDQDANDT